MARILFVVLVLLSAAPVGHTQVVAPERCPNGKKPKEYVKHTRTWRTLVTTANGTTLSNSLQRVGRNANTQWSTAVSMPIGHALANREITAADVTLTFKSISGAVHATVVPYGYTGYQWDGRRGSIELAPAAALLQALQVPGWINSEGIFTTKGPHVLITDDFAFEADSIAWDEDHDFLSFFIAPGGTGFFQGDLKQVTLTLYHCPIEEF